MADPSADGGLNENDAASEAFDYDSYEYSQFYVGSNSSYMYNYGAESDWLNTYWQFAVSSDLSLYLPPFYLLLGIPSNLMCVVVLVQFGCRRVSSCFYLAVLALADLYLICQRAGNDWSRHLWDLDIHDLILNKTDVSCQVYSFLSNLVTHTSGWLLAAAHLEHVLILARPAHAHSVYRPERAKNTMLVVLLFLVCVNAHFFWTYGLAAPYARSKQFYCNFAPYGSYVSDLFRKTVWPCTDYLMRDVIPHLLIMCCLVYRLTKHVRRKSYQRELLSNRFLLDFESTRIYGRVLLALGLAFLVLTLPETGYDLFEFVVERAGNELFTNMGSFARRDLTQTVCSDIKDLFMVMKIFIYIGLWRDFRLKILDLMTLKCCRARDRNDSIAHEVTTLGPDAVSLMNTETCNDANIV